MLSNATINTPISNNKVSIIFPDRCVYCGEPRTTNLNLKTEKRVSGKIIPLIIEFKVPFCRRHANLSMIEKLIISATGWGLGFIGMTAYFLTLFSPVQSFLEKYVSNRPVLYFILLFGPVLIVGFGGGYAIGIGILSFIGRKFSKSLADLIALQQYDVQMLGIGATISSDGSRLNLQLTNEAFRQEFLELNNQHNL